MNKIIKFIGNVGLPLLVGATVGLIINPYINYNELNQPPLSPPSIIFPIAWTIIYFLMGLSYFLLKNPNKSKSIYYLQLLVNALWSIFFFIFKWYLLSFIWIILLIILVIIMIIQFYRNNKKAGILNIPYLLWLIFACYLNLGIFILN